MAAAAFLPGVGGGVGGHPAGVGDLERGPAVVGRKGGRAVVHVGTWRQSRRQHQSSQSGGSGGRGGVLLVLLERWG